MLAGSATSTNKSRHRCLKQETEENAAKTQPSESKTSKEGKQKDRRRLLVVFLIIIVIVATTLQVKATNQNTRSGSLRSKPGTLDIEAKQSKSQTDTEPGICINSLEDMPKHWQPLDDLYEDSGQPWSKDEQALADEAVEKGLDELVQFYKHNMTLNRIKKLKTDAVNSLIDEAYASANRPAYHKKALRAAARVLKINAARFASPKDRTYRGCQYQYEKLKYVGYGQYLVQNLPDDPELRTLQQGLISNVNVMIQECGTLERLIGIRDRTTIFQVENEHADPVFDWVLQAIALTDCLTVPDLHLPEGTEEFVANLWDYLGRYDWPYARHNRKHFGDYTTRNTAWLATHVAYIPTGYGRHKQLIDDAPYLYKYLRENFYYALEYGMLDLFCEFVDLVRQYGCTEDNDYQVRHGTRYILSLYEKAGHSWMNYREEGKGRRSDRGLSANSQAVDGNLGCDSA